MGVVNVCLVSRTCPTYKLAAVFLVILTFVQKSQQAYGQSRSVSGGISPCAVLESSVDLARIAVTTLIAMNSLKLKIPKKTLDVQVTTVDAVLEFQIDVSGIQSS